VCVCVSYGSDCKQRLFPQTALTSNRQCPSRLNIRVRRTCTAEEIEMQF
jgi:hypothetical protein